MCGIGAWESPSSAQIDDSRRFSTKLLKLTSKIIEASQGESPRDLAITGVILRDNHAKGQGTHADIYNGEYQGTLVSVNIFRDVAVLAPWRD